LFVVLLDHRPSSPTPPSDTRSQSPVASIWFPVRVCLWRLGLPCRTISGGEKRRGKGGFVKKSELKSLLAIILTVEHILLS